jgi:hypothetical protein
MEKLIYYNFILKMLFKDGLPAGLKGRNELGKGG